MNYFAGAWRACLAELRTFPYRNRPFNGSSRPMAFEKLLL